MLRLAKNMVAATTEGARYGILRQNDAVGRRQNEVSC